MKPNRIGQATSCVALALALLPVSAFGKPQQTNPKEPGYDLSITGIPNLRTAKAIKQIPIEVRQSIKGNVLPCFFGSVQIQQKAPALFVYIYCVGKTAKDRARCWVNLYESKSIAQRKKAVRQQLSLVNRFELHGTVERMGSEHKDMRWNPEVVFKREFLDVQCFWLDPKQRSIPTIKVDSQDARGEGDCFIIKFMEGWSNAPAVDSYYSENWMASDSTGTMCICAGVGKDGLLNFYQGMQVIQTF